MSTVTLHINSGFCKCGCSWEDHHLGIMMNKDVVSAIRKWSLNNPEKLHIENWTFDCYPLYVPQECEGFGCNEYGGMKYDEETDSFEYHCDQYEDKDGPLAEIEY